MQLVRRLSSVGAAIVMLLALPLLASAQEATIIGKVTDSTGGVLPGVTITAVHEATGTQFVGVTDTLGVYRIPVRIGDFRITAELPGFATIHPTLMAPSAAFEAMRLGSGVCEAPLRRRAVTLHGLR